MFETTCGLYLGLLIENWSSPRLLFLGPEVLAVFAEPDAARIGELVACVSQSRSGTTSHCCSHCTPGLH